MTRTVALTQIPAPLVGAPDTAAQPKHYLIAPNGKIITRVVIDTGPRSAEVSGNGLAVVTSEGGIEDYVGDDNFDYAGSEPISPGDGGGFFVSCGDGRDWLQRHCRVFADTEGVIEESGMWYYEHPDLWPENVERLCCRAEQVAWSIVKLGDLQQTLPRDYQTDPVLTAVLDAVVKGRLMDELTALDAQIAAFRAGASTTS